MQYSFIWDLDGTLLDSYHVIVSCIHDALQENGIEVDREEIFRRSIQTSVGDFLEQLQKKCVFDMEKVKSRNRELSRERVLNIKLMPNAALVLQKLTECGHLNLVYTHKGDTAGRILEHLGIRHFFREVVNSQYGFPRKPESDAIDYLVRKHGLSREKTFYVGDRSIDILCALNAQIGSILYLPSGSCVRPVGTESFIVEDLLDILKIIEK